MAADHYRLPRPVGPTPGIELGVVRPSTAEAVRALLLPRVRTAWIEALVLCALWLVAVAIRLPHLWTIPQLTDESRLLLDALARYQGVVWLGQGAALISAGALHEAIFATAFALVGPSAYLPRLVTAIQAALTVPLVYVLTRELCRPLGRRRLEEMFLMPRLAGLVAAGLLATSAAHVVVTSHVARPDSFTPLFVVALLFAVERALNTRNGRWLVAAGLLLGLALQTSPVVLAIVPGLVLAVWWRGRALVASHWAVLAILALTATYTSLLVPLLAGQGVSLTTPGLAETPLVSLATGRGPTGEVYLDSFGVALVAVWRILASQLTSRPTAEDALSDPLAWPFIALAVIGGMVLVLRGRPLLPLVAVSCLVIVPYFSAEPDLLLNGRYLMPVAVVAIATIGAAVGALAPLVTGRGSLPRLALGVALGGLVLAPLSGLRAYYSEASGEGRTGEGLLRLPPAVFDERRYDEVVLLDERLADLPLGAGGNVLESVQYLLTAHGVPTRVVQATPAEINLEMVTGGKLIVLERGSLPVLGLRIGLTPLLDEWILGGAIEDGEVADEDVRGAMLFRANLGGRRVDTGLAAQELVPLPVEKEEALAPAVGG